MSLTKSDEIRYFNSLEPLVNFLKQNLEKFKKNKIFELNFELMLLSIQDIMNSGTINKNIDNFLETDDIIVLEYGISTVSNVDREITKTKVGYFITDFNLNEVYFITEINELGMIIYNFDIFYLKSKKIKHISFKTVSLDDITISGKALTILPKIKKDK